MDQISRVWVCCTLRQVVLAAKQISNHKYHLWQRWTPTLRYTHEVHTLCSSYACFALAAFLWRCARSHKNNNNRTSSVKCVMYNNHHDISENRTHRCATWASDSQTATAKITLRTKAGDLSVWVCVCACVTVDTHSLLLFLLFWK